MADTVYAGGMGRKRKPAADLTSPTTSRELVPGFAAMIRAVREALGWTVPQLAEASGVAMSSVWAIESEKRAPSLRVASALVAALGVRVLLNDPARPIGPAPTEDR